jgi:arylsulfatase A-like enzyme/Flp pilus assembly protein TadD
VARPVRFTIILLLVACATVLAAFGGWRFARASAPVNGPIILISIDSLRADHLPAYGYTKVRTPAIDTLAADGIVFERAYAHAPQTLPAHTSLFSGRLPFDTGVRDDEGFVVKPGERLLPQMLSDRGFSTGGVVSTSLLGKSSGFSRGFEFFDGTMPPVPPDERVERVKRDGAEAEAVAERWLDQQRSSRVFLFLHLYEPHRPHVPPPRFAEYEAYDGEIAYADEIVGRLIRHLKTQQLYDRSTIILLSDHGEGLGDHGEQEHGLFLYDNTIHVPLIIKQVGNSGAGRRIGAVVQHVDIVPTVLELAKAPIPGNLRGRSLTPILDGTGELSDEGVYSEAWYGRIRFGWSGLKAWTDRRHRYIEAPDEELYDLEHDPGERENLAATRTTDRDAARVKLAALNAESPADGAIDPKDKRDIVERYRRVADLEAHEEWTRAIAQLEAIVREEPMLVSVWLELGRAAARIDRFGVAAAAYVRAEALSPDDAAPSLGAASAFLRLNRFEEARMHAEAAAEKSPEARGQARAHEMLAQIALARREPDEASREAMLAAQADPKLPMASYVNGRLLYDRGRFGEASPAFEETMTMLSKHPDASIEDAAFYAGDTLSRLERYSEAEAAFEEQLRLVPYHARARAGLALIYAKTGRTDEAEQAISELIRLSPTPDGYALGSRVWRALGKPRQADALRAESRKSAPASRGGDGHD